MLLDARRLPSGDVIDADLCVLGAGPAGLTLASELIDSGLRVCVLESGGVALEERQQDLSDATNHGTALGDLRRMRRRQLGGNSNAWNIAIGDGEIGVRYVPLDAYDLAPRPWLAHSGWPLRADELTPYYQRAHEICELGPFAYGGEAWEDEAAPRLPLDARRVTTGVFRFGRSDVFYGALRTKLERASDVQLFVHATALELLTDESGQRVERVKVASVPGHHVYVRAHKFALCLGALENARLLLLSSRHHRAGIGNQHDLVGRYFMDHPLVDAGRFTPRDAQLFARASLYDLRRVGGQPVMGRLSLSESAMRDEQLLNATAYLFPRPSPRQASAVHAIGLLKDPLRLGELPKRPLRSLLRVAAGLDYVLYAAYLQRMAGQAVLHGFARGGWSQLPSHLARFESFQVLLQTEQSPDPSNRLWLGPQRDRFGARKLELLWRWSDDDRRRIARTQRLLAEALRPLGELALHVDRDGLPEQSLPAGLAHHMGTTRMHADPRQGVVDPNARVHGVQNLYVAGSSLFPTGGYANPTLTILALAIRLAHHLRP